MAVCYYVCMIYLGRDLLSGSSNSTGLRCWPQTQGVIYIYRWYPSSSISFEARGSPSRVRNDYSDCWWQQFLREIETNITGRAVFYKMISSWYGHVLSTARQLEGRYVWTTPMQRLLLMCSKVEIEFMTGALWFLFQVPKCSLSTTICRL